jgi:hypothetical protein
MLLMTIRPLGDCDHLNIRVCVHFSAVNRSRNLMNLGSRQPVLGNDVFVASNAVVVGDVQLGNQSSVYMGAVLRGKALFRFALEQIIIIISFMNTEGTLTSKISTLFSSPQVIVAELALAARPTSRMAL